MPAVFFELNYVLLGVYKLTKKESVNLLTNVTKTLFIDIDNRSILIQTLEAYKKINIDLVDIYLYFFAKENKAEVLSFDKDFEKIKKFTSN